MEPATCDSRITPPFDTREEAGELLYGVFGKIVAEDAEKRCHSRTKTGISADWEVENLCRSVPLASFEEWRALVLDPTTGAALRDSAYYHRPEVNGLGLLCEIVPSTTDASRLLRRFGIGVEDMPGGEKHNMAGHQNPQPKQQSERVLYVGNWYRSLNTELITTAGACTKTPCWGVQFARAPRFIEFARATAAAVGRYTCVQWRSETKANSLNVEECAQKLVRSTSHAWQMQSAGGYSADRDAPVLLVTDLYEGASSTYGASRNQKAFSLALEVRSKYAFESLCVFYFIMCQSVFF